VFTENPFAIVNLIILLALL